MDFIFSLFFFFAKQETNDKLLSSCGYEVGLAATKYVNAAKIRPYILQSPQEAVPLRCYQKYAFKCIHVPRKHLGTGGTVY